MLPQLVLLSASPHWVDALELPLGDSVVNLDDGLIFEVGACDTCEPVGWAYVGGATFQFPFHDRGEALGFAATLQGPGKMDAEIAGLALDALSWTETTDILLVLGQDPQWLEPLEAMPRVSQGPGNLYYVDGNGLQITIVTGIRVGASRRTASRALSKRQDQLQKVGLDPFDMIEVDATLRQGTRRAIVEARTQRDWKPFLEPAYPTLSDRWLTWVRDPTGAVDDAYGEVIAVHGLGPEEQPKWRPLTGVPHAAGTERPRITGAQANVVVAQTGAGVGLDVDITARIYLETSAPTQLVDLAIPRRNGDFDNGFVQVAPAFKLDSVTQLDGTALPLRSMWGPVPDTREHEVWTVVLPEPLHPGDSLPLTVKWTQQWPAAHVLMVREWAYAKGSCFRMADLAHPICKILDRLPEVLTLGRVAAGQPVFPVVPSDHRLYEAELRVGTVAAPRWKAAIGGGTVEERTVGDGRFQVGTVRSNARVSFGDLSVDVAEAAKGFPEIRVLLHEPWSAGSPSYLRSIMNFYQTALPNYPYDELVVVQASARPFLTGGGDAAGLAQDMGPPFPTVRHYPGHIVISGLREVSAPALEATEVASSLSGGNLQRSIDRDYPHVLERQVAEAVAADWWYLDWPQREAWLGGALPALYRDLFTEHAWDPEILERWDHVIQQRVLASGPTDMAPIQGHNPTWRNEVGARLFREGLRARIGERQLLRGLDRFRNADVPDQAALEAALEDASGVQLDDFFDYWLVAGIRPRVEASWRRDGNTVVVDVTTDVPFGRTEIPVDITSRKGTTTVWVEVVDGAGRDRASVRGEVESVQLDPNQWLPLRRRTVRRNDVVASE